MNNFYIWKIQKVFQCNPGLQASLTRKDIVTLATLTGLPDNVIKRNFARIKNLMQD